MKPLRINQQVEEAIPFGLQIYHVDHAGMPPGSRTAAALERAWQTIYNRIYGPEHASLTQYQELREFIRHVKEQDSHTGEHFNGVQP